MQAWVRLPLEMLKSDLSKSAVLVYAVILDRADKGKATVSTAELARITGLSRSTTKRAIKELVAAEQIESDTRTQRGTEYKLRSPALPPKLSKAPYRKPIADNSDGFDAEKYKGLINQV